MEHAKITRIIAHVAIVNLIQPMITGDLINKTIGTQLRVIATDANLMVIDKITIDQVNVPLEVTMGLALAHTNLAREHLMINNTTSANAVATRNNLIRMTTVQEMVAMLSVLIHANNIKDKIDTEEGNDVN